MARPQRIEKLRHGRLLCGSVFRFFVETWNWLSAYVDNMQGDAETDPQSGHITIDRSDPDHPVIRFRADKVASGDEKTVIPDDISIEFIPNDPAQGADNTHEGELQIKGFKDGAPADQNTFADYLQGAANIPNSGISIVCRRMTSGGRELFYLPLAAIWGDGSSGGVPRPEVTYLDDVTWDTSNHQLIKHWVTKNIVTGAETPVQGAPQGKTATIDTTPISSILPQSGGS